MEIPFENFLGMHGKHLRGVVEPTHGFFPLHWTRAAQSPDDLPSKQGSRQQVSRIRVEVLDFGRMYCLCEGQSEASGCAARPMSWNQKPAAFLRARREGETFMHEFRRDRCSQIPSSVGKTSDFIPEQRFAQAFDNAYITQNSMPPVLQVVVLSVVQRVNQAG